MRLHRNSAARRVAAFASLAAVTLAFLTLPSPTVARSDPSLGERALPETEIVDLGDGVQMEFVLIRPGVFAMGTDTHEPDEAPVRRITLTQPYYIGRYEVTQQQWEKVMGTNPSQFKDPTRPVENVSWDDAQRFVQALTRQTGKTCALPTEAQWEYACRAGTESEYSFGDDAAQLNAHAWYAQNSALSTHPVGKKAPNPWGLHDMHGNVYEWCHDWYSEGPYPAADVIDPSGPRTGWRRALRGGAWIYVADNLRSADRGFSPPDHRSPEIGFRCILLVDPPQPGPHASARAGDSASEARMQIRQAVERAIAHGDRLQAEWWLQRAGRRFHEDGDAWRDLERAVAKLPPPPAETEVQLGEGVTLQLVLIRPDLDRRNRSDSADGTDGRRKQPLTPYYIGKYEVTQKQWIAVMGHNPSAFVAESAADDLPVDNVSWQLCQQFTSKLNARETPFHFRLPTEAEWEFACRAGTKEDHHFREGTLDDYAWYGQNSGNRTHAVGKKKPNPWGLHDMYGNVWEWCQDSFASGTAAPADAVVHRLVTGERVVRGGAWNSLAKHVNSGFRYGVGPSLMMRYHGLRCVAVPKWVSELPPLEE
jgi:formylglycine-generating enzyme required for sulfatase activity